MGKIFKKLMLYIFYCLGIYRIFRFLNKDKVVILSYHGITENRRQKGIENCQGNHLQIEKFTKQIKYLSKVYNFISLDNFVEAVVKRKKLPHHSVVITIDDGYRNNYTNTFPILQRYNIPATIFLATNLVGTEKLFWNDLVEHAFNYSDKKIVEIDIGGVEYTFDLNGVKEKMDAERKIRKLLKSLPSEEEKNKVLGLVIEKLGSNLGHFPNDYKCLDWDEVKQMRKAGVTFGSHTDNHLILTKIPIDQAKKEIKNSKEKIERHLKEEIKTFCYPNGGREDFNEEIKTMLKNMDFSCALSLIYGLNSLNSDLFELRRVGVNNNDHPLRFIADLSGFTVFYQKMRRKIRSGNKSKSINRYYQKEKRNYGE